MRQNDPCMASATDDVKSVDNLNAEEISDMTFEDALALVEAPAVVLA
jgi:hypothetical protein